MRGGYTKSNTIYVAWKCDDTSATFADGNIAYYVNGATNAWTAVANSDFMFRVLEATAGANYFIDGANLSFESGQLSYTYYTSVKDLGYICDARVMIQDIITLAQSLAWDSDPTRKFDDSQTLRFTGEEYPADVTFQIRTSDDNTTWSSWSDWIVADYTGRYFQIKMTITRVSATLNLTLSSLIITADLPDVDETQDYTISVAANGAAITFAKTYHEIPSVNVDILSGSGIVHIFSVAPSITGCTIKHLALAGTEQTGNGRIHVHGI